MSCEKEPNKIAKIAGRISGGIAPLAGKRGFYAGLALGGAGLIGAGLVAVARRRSRGQQGDRSPPTKPALVDRRQVPQLSRRDKISPMTTPVAGERCAGCKTPSGRKPGPWYSLNGRSYCPDCAPAAAGQANVDLVTIPAGLNGPAAWTPATTRSAQKQAPYLSPERRVPVKLEPSRVGVYAGQNDQGQPVRVAVNKGYVILRQNGAETGLALTPGLKMSKPRPDEIEEDTGRWYGTHIASGKHIPGAGPYARPEAGRLLAGVLAQLDWTREESEMTTAEIRQVEATVSAYNAALTAEKKKPAGASWAEPAGSQRLPANESLAGRLVADGYGGVARVLEDSGKRLFVIDSLGERYEVARNQVRTPDEADFEGVRVAMSFDPAQQPAEKCALCQRPTSGTGAGEMWYKMNFKSFCESCATQYAAEEAYIKEDEVGDAVELAG